MSNRLCLVNDIYAKVIVCIHLVIVDCSIITDPLGICNDEQTITIDDGRTSRKIQQLIRI